MQCPACGAEIADAPPSAPAAALRSPRSRRACCSRDATRSRPSSGPGPWAASIAPSIAPSTRPSRSRCSTPRRRRSVEITRRFRNEIKLARRVRHVNVCAIHEYGEDGPLQFVAMELVDGADLQRVLRERGPLPPGEIFDGGPPGGAGARRHPRCGRHPPRPQGLEHRARSQRGGAPARLRNRQAPHPDGHPRPHRYRARGRHPRVHEPGADPRRRPRSTQRHLLLRGRAVRALHRDAALRRQDTARHHAAPGQRAAAALRRPGRPRTPRARHRVAPGPREGPRGATRLRPRARGGAPLRAERDPATRRRASRRRPTCSPGRSRGRRHGPSPPRRSLRLRSPRRLSLRRPSLAAGRSGWIGRRCCRGSPAPGVRRRLLRPSSPRARRPRPPRWIPNGPTSSFPLHRTRPARLCALRPCPSGTRNRRRLLSGPAGRHGSSRSRRASSSSCWSWPSARGSRPKERMSRRCRPRRQPPRPPGPPPTPRQPRSRRRKRLSRPPPIVRDSPPRHRSRRPGRQPSRRSPCPKRRRRPYRRRLRPRPRCPLRCSRSASAPGPR